jgi:hypothetical protein
MVDKYEHSNISDGSLVPANGPVLRDLIYGKRNGRWRSYRLANIGSVDPQPGKNPNDKGDFTHREADSKDTFNPLWRALRANALSFRLAAIPVVPQPFSYHSIQ